jgi:hypothetical protein
MSSANRRRQISEGSISRSRERPPDQKRERGPAGDRTADLTNTNNNGNAAIHSLAKRQEQANRRRRRQRMAALAWRLGARAYFEFLDELDRHYDIPDLDRRLEKYANADPNLVALLGSDQFPAGPTRIIGGGR